MDEETLSVRPSPLTPSPLHPSTASSSHTFFLLSGSTSPALLPSPTLAPTLASSHISIPSLCSTSSLFIFLSLHPPPLSISFSLSLRLLYISLFIRLSFASPARLHLSSPFRDYLLSLHCHVPVFSLLTSLHLHSLHFIPVTHLFCLFPLPLLILPSVPSPSLTPSFQLF